MSVGRFAQTGREIFLHPDGACICMTMCAGKASVRDCTLKSSEHVDTKMCFVYAYTHLKLDQVHPPVRTDIYLESVQMDSRLQVDILSIFQRKEREDKKTMFLN